VALCDVNAGAQRLGPNGRRYGGFIEYRRGQYRFSILLIDDIPRIGLERIYRITMPPQKENDMNRVANTALAALTLSVCSITAIVTVPPAQAETPAAFALPVVA
jgi:hypothetical protein